MEPVFFNSSRFNFYEGDQPVRERLPFSVTWDGAIEVEEPVELRVTYLGEGRVAVGCGSVELEPS